MLVLLRHSERLDRTDEGTWRRSRRYKENSRDTPITRNGLKIAAAASRAIIKEFKKIDYLYCSPLTRCVQTCKVVQQEIRRLTGHLLPIRIDYGLVEVVWPPLVRRGDLIAFDAKKQYMDSKLGPGQIRKRFPRTTIHKSYRPQVKFSEARLFPSTALDSINRACRTVKGIRTTIPSDKVALLCVHGGVMKYYDWIQTKEDNGYLKIAYCGVLAYNKDGSVRFSKGVDRDND